VAQEKDKKEDKKEDKKPVLPKKPDKISHPDPIKRFKALQEWHKLDRELSGIDEPEKYEPKKTLEKAEEKLTNAHEQDAIMKEVIAIEKEIGATKDEEKKLSLSEQLKKLKEIRDKKKDKEKKKG